MIQFQLLSISLGYLFFVLWSLYCDLKKRGVSLFAPEVIFLFYALINAVALLYFSINIGYLENTVHAGRFGSSYFATYVYVYALTVSVAIFYYYSVKFAYRLKLGSLNSFLRFFVPSDDIALENKNNRLKIIALLIFACGVFVLYSVLSRIGGIQFFLQNQGLRVELLSGMGYEIKLSVFFITTSTYFLFFLNIKRNVIVAFSFVLLGLFFLSWLGSRGTVLGLIILVMIVYYYKVKRFDLMRLKYLLFAPLLILLLISMGKLREKGAYNRLMDNPVEFFASSLEGIEKNIITYGADIYRDYVIVNYFREHDFWLGKTYMSLLLAPVPRKYYPDKPPIDSGMYIVAIDKGYNIDPPVPSRDLPGWGWPEGNMVGYSNFGFLGLFLLNFFSACISVSIYKYAVNSNFGLLPLFVYALVCSGGIVVLSPAGIVGIIFLFFSLYFFSFFLKKKIVFS